jgi:hypothetical protein
MYSRQRGDFLGDGVDLVSQRKIISTASERSATLGKEALGERFIANFRQFHFLRLRRNTCV